MSRPACSISVDLDPLRCYESIHGLTSAASGPDPIYTHALPRLLDLFADMGVRATFFVIAADLDAPEHVAALQRALLEGHELASHTHDHPYDLPRLDDDAHRAQLTRAHDRISDLVGAPIVGFRAPGYNIDARTIAALETLGYTYDASIFPCPPYYAAKAAVMAALWLRGRPSRSSLIDPRTQLAPLRPYTPSRRAVHRRAASPADASGLLELPMCVLPGARWPLIGTSLILMGPALTGRVLEAAARYHTDFISLELHGIDAIDPDLDPIPDALRARQPDLRHGIARKVNVLRAAYAALHNTYDFIPCAEAARRSSLVPLAEL